MKTEILTAVLLKIRVFWDVSLGYVVPMIFKDCGNFRVK
jgi:hypothetical protein